MESTMTYLETLERWNSIKEAIKNLQAEERALREGLFGGTFTNPREGVNNFALPENRGTLKGTYVLNRGFNKDFLASVKPVLPKSFVSAIALPVEIVTKVVKVSYELRVGPYKELTKEQQKEIDKVLEIKPGLPQLEFAPPKAVIE